MLRRPPSCPPQLETHHLKSNALVAAPGRLGRNESINIYESEENGGEEGNHVSISPQLISYFCKNGMSCSFC